MAVFKCLQSGNLVEFILPHDIESMKGHAGYIRIDAEDQKEPEQRLNIPMLPPKKKVGRPKSI